MNQGRNRHRAWMIVGTLLMIGGILLYRVGHQRFSDQGLAAAIKRGDSSAVTDFLASGADPNVRVSMFGPLSPRAQMLRLFQRTRPKEPDYTEIGASKLCGCPTRVSGTDVFDVMPEDLVITEALLRHGANVDALDDYGQTALGWAVILRRPQTVRLLLEHGANPNVSVCLTDELHIHVHGKQERLLTSVHNRASLLQEAFCKSTAEDGSAEIGRMLVLHGAAYTAPGRNEISSLRYKISPLIVAVLAGDRQGVQSLLKAGADVNARTGDDPMIWPQFGFGSSGAVQKGRTALGWLSRCIPRQGDSEIKRMLVQVGGHE